MTEASVVICAYKFERWDDLRAAVASAHAQISPAREVIVVVDRNEALLERARAELDGTIVAPNVNAPGSSGARATGARLATAPVIAYMDDDAIADPAWLAEHLACYDRPEVLGTGGWVEPLWRSERPAWFPPEFDWVVGCTWPGFEAPDGRIRNAIAVNMSVRADVLERIGGMPPELSRLEIDGIVTGTAEETELCIRATRMHPGGYWMFAPAARVRHVVTEERATWAYFVRRCRLEGAAKAIVTDLAGANDGLSSERLYVRSVLPRAVLRDLRAALRGDRSGLSRVAAIVAGLAITSWTYARGRAARRIALVRRRR